MRRLTSSIVRRCWPLFLVIPLLLWPAPSRAEQGHPLKLRQDDKCPVCGMFVAKYPKWVAGIVFKDGSYAVFDGCKDMFKYLFHLKRYNPGKSREDIAQVYVTEYYTTRIVPARDVLFVVGSDVLGPMGHELIPVQGEGNAQTFATDHKGKKILKFEEIKPADIPK